jgi:predicted nucleic acid-binding protein
MTILYIETSALLTWLFNEPGSNEVIDTINHTDLIVTSELLRIETVRAVKRLYNEELITSEQMKSLLDIFDRHMKSWFIMSIDETIVTGSLKDFPAEPVRSLNAIHLATALEYKNLYPELKMLTKDKRILQNTEALGLNGNESV